MDSIRAAELFEALGEMNEQTEAIVRNASPTFRDALDSTSTALLAALKLAGSGDVTALRWLWANLPERGLTTMSGFAAVGLLDAITRAELRTSADGGE